MAGYGVFRLTARERIVLTSETVHFSKKGRKAHALKSLFGTK